VIELVQDAARYLVVGLTAALTLASASVVLLMIWTAARSCIVRGHVVVAGTCRRCGLWLGTDWKE